MQANVPAWATPLMRRNLGVHFETIQVLIKESKEDVRAPLSVIVHRLGLPADAMDGGPIATPGSVALTWIKDASPSDAHETAMLSTELARLRSAVDDLRGQTALLVDPELFVAVEGETMVVASALGVGETSSAYVTPTVLMRATMAVPVAPLPAVAESWRSADDRVRWLPSEVQIDRDTGKASIRSYINNLHPVKFEGIYTWIEHLMTELVPLFENVLSSLDENADLRFLKGLYDYCRYSLPRAPQLVPRGLFDVGNAQFPLRGTQCQLVIRLSEITLTPATKSFSGDTWRCEGYDADNIIATGVFFHCVKNITPPQLLFRQLVRYPDIKPDDDVTLGLEFGLQSHDVLAQALGNVTARQGHSAVFPNLYQYKVGPFGLEDCSKPGRLSMVTVMLVAPMARSEVSTAVVPPQQCDWIQQERDLLLRRLPLPKVMETLVRDFARDGTSLDEAKQRRDARLARLGPRQAQESHFLWFQRREREGLF